MTDNAVRQRKQQTPAQKQAGGLRRDASILERLAKGDASMLATAAKLKAQADALAPAAPKQVSEPRRPCSFTNGDGQCQARAQKGSTTCFSHSDPVTKLTADEWQAVEQYFMAGDFRANLLQVTSWRKLKGIATPAA